MLSTSIKKEAGLMNPEIITIEMDHHLDVTYAAVIMNLQHREVMVLVVSNGNGISHEGNPFQGAVDALVEMRQKKIEAFVKEFDGRVSEEIQKKVTDATVCELADLIRKQIITSEQAVTVYSLRAATLGLEYKVIADVCFTEAIEKAREIDKNIREGVYKDNFPPLLGVPFTVLATLIALIDLRS
jgi:hypothetical protein